MEVLIKPLITEKMTKLAEESSTFGFIVNRKSNKIDIKKAIEKMYGVTVESVRTANYIGKARSRFTKSGTITGKTAAFKKALIKLKEGDKIDFFSNV